MILIIDGYNILKRQHGVRLIDDTIRKRFIHGVAGYARHSGNKVVVVFDGGAHDDAYEEYGRGVQVVYSGMRETADDYIKRYVEKHSTKDLMLVTSDRELNSIADRYQIPSLDAHEFVRVLMYSESERSGQTSSTHAPIIKTSSEDIPELDALMEQASKMVPQKSDDVAQVNRKSAAQKISKKERELLKKVKKL
jgi:predicted RNA-binding protein with PIN domain